MREIKFRGRNLKNEDWHYGGIGWEPHEDDYRPCIVSTFWNEGYEDQESVVLTPVIPGTIGQYTGLKDKNGEPIYEGDVLKTPIGIARVEFFNGAFYGVTKTADFCPGEDDEIIGNIHETPELLKSE